MANMAELAELALKAEALREAVWTAAGSAASPAEHEALRSAEACLWLVRKTLNSVTMGTPMTVAEIEAKTGGA